MPSKITVIYSYKKIDLDLPTWHLQDVIVKINKTLFIHGSWISKKEAELGQRVDFELKM